MNFFKLISVFILLISYYTCFGQTLIHTQEFAVSSPTGWTTIDNGGSSSWVLNSSSSPCSGTHFARLSPVANSDDYIISQGFTLTAGYSYSITLTYRSTVLFNVYAGTAQTSAAMLAGTNMLSTAVSPSSCTDISTTNSFVPSTTGTYYFGFRAQPDANSIIMDPFSCTTYSKVKVYL